MCVCVCVCVCVYHHPFWGWGVGKVLSTSLRKVTLLGHNRFHDVTFSLSSTPFMEGNFSSCSKCMTRKGLKTVEYLYLMCLLNSQHCQNSTSRLPADNVRTVCVCVRACVCMCVFVCVCLGGFFALFFSFSFFCLWMDMLKETLLTFIFRRH